MCKSLLAICCITMLLAGCSKTPMQALQSDSPYNGYDEQFWSHERIQQTPLWHEARTYCQQNTSMPNCAPVIQQIFFDGSTNVPKYGSSGNYLKVPNF